MPRHEARSRRTTCPEESTQQHGCLSLSAQTSVQPFAHPIAVLGEELNSLDSIHSHFWANIEFQYVLAADGSFEQLVSCHGVNVRFPERVRQGIQPLLAGKRFGCFDPCRGHTELNPVSTLVTHP